MNALVMIDSEACARTGNYRNIDAVVSPFCGDRGFNPERIPCRPPRRGRERRRGLLDVGAGLACLRHLTCGNAFWILGP